MASHLGSAQQLPAQPPALTQQPPAQQLPAQPPALIRITQPQLALGDTHSDLTGYSFSGPVAEQFFIGELDASEVRTSTCSNSFWGPRDKARAAIDAAQQEFPHPLKGIPRGS